MTHDWNTALLCEVDLAGLTSGSLPLASLTCWRAGGVEPSGYEALMPVVERRQASQVVTFDCTCECLSQGAARIGRFDEPVDYSGIAASLRRLLCRGNAGHASTFLLDGNGSGCPVDSSGPDSAAHACPVQLFSSPCAGWGFSLSLRPHPATPEMN